MVTLLALCVSLEPVSLMTTETKESEDHRRRIFDRRRRVYTRSTPSTTPSWTTTASGTSSPTPNSRGPRHADAAFRTTALTQCLMELSDHCLMDYRRGVPLFLSRGLLSTDYELTGYRLHRYRLYRILLFPDDLHELFNCLTVCYYRHPFIRLRCSSSNFVCIVCSIRLLYLLLTV